MRSTRVLPLGGDPGLGAHLRRFGPRPHRGLGMQLLAEIHASGLRGKGGAGFPAAVKLETAARGAGPAVVVANGTEGEPGSAKDRILLNSSPHLVLDGVAAAAAAIGATEAVVCVKRSAITTARALRAALAERAGDRLRPTLAFVPDGYVSGEESSIVRWLNEADARPTFATPLPAYSGVGGRPTAVLNVETFAHIGLIERYGSAWFREEGTADEPGTTLVTVHGGTSGAAVAEVALGTPIGEVVAAALGPSAPSVSACPAVLVGGYFGTWLPGGAAATIPLTRADLAAVGASLGCGLIAAIPPGHCALAELAAVTAWMAGQSVGQCGPCANGLPAIAGAVEALRLGTADQAVRNDLRRWLTLVEGRGACRHPDGTARLVRSGLQVMASDVDWHAHRGPCPAQKPLLPTPHPPRRGQ